MEFVLLLTRWVREQKRLQQGLQWTLKTVLRPLAQQTMRHSAQQRQLPQERCPNWLGADFRSKQVTGWPQKTLWPKQP